MRSSFILLFLLFFLLAACTPFAKQQIPITATATPEFTPVVTAVLTPTITLPPTVTPTLTNTSTPSRTSTLTLTPTRTPHDTPGFIVTFGESGAGGWPAIPVFSSDGKMIALASERIRLWDIHSQEFIRELARPYSECYTENASFSPDSNLFAVSIDCVPDYDHPGHLLIWDTRTGDLLHDWEQGYTKDTSKLEGVRNIRVPSGITFINGSSQIAFGNGNTIEIRNIREDSESMILELGENMFASDISVSEDGNVMYVFMDFNYSSEPNRITQEYAVQIWDLKSKTVLHQVEFPTGDSGGFFGHFDASMSLMDKFLTNADYINGVYEITDLETWEVKTLPLQGDLEVYPSPDTNYVIFFPTVFEMEGTDCNIGGVELWNVNKGQMLYTFKVPKKDFHSKWCYAPHTFAISADNNLLAISHNERVSLWEISNAVKTKATP